MKHKNPDVDKKIREAVRETKRNIKKIVLQLKNMKLIDEFVFCFLDNDLDFWLRKYFDIKGWLPIEIKQVIHERIISLGMMCYHQISPFTPPDHVMSPPALAYLLSQSEEYFPKFKAEAIRFDHGDTLETFKKQADGLFENVVKQLITPRSIEKIPRNKRNREVYDPHPCCNTCC